MSAFPYNLFKAWSSLSSLCCQNLCSYILPQETGSSRPNKKQCILWLMLEPYSFTSPEFLSSHFLNSSQLSWTMNEFPMLADTRCLISICWMNEKDIFVRTQYSFSCTSSFLTGTQPDFLYGNVKVHSAIFFLIKK